MGEDADALVALGSWIPRAPVLVVQAAVAVIGRCARNADSIGQRRAHRYRTNALTYKVRSQAGGVVVLGEILVQTDWHATLDGRPVERAHVVACCAACGVTAASTRWSSASTASRSTASRPYMMAASALVLLLALGAGTPSAFGLA